MTIETCPKCGSHFPANETWTNPPSFYNMIGWGFMNVNVKCPSCKNVFPATEYRFFGLIQPKKFRYSLAAFEIIFISISVIFILF
jgi:ribosomal protein S27AE